jgi:hypothetical protein
VAFLTHAGEIILSEKKRHQLKITYVVNQFLNFCLVCFLRFVLILFKIFDLSKVETTVKYKYYCSDLKLNFCICEADIYAIANVPYRVLTYSHSATSLYNWANLSQSAISLRQLFTSCPHLTCKRASFGLVLFFAIFIIWLQKYLDFVLFSPISRAILLAILFRSYLSTWKLILIW